jgi:hypothetical protein
MHFPVDFGNDLVRDPSFSKKLQGVLEKIRPEAMYFTPTDGERGGYVVVNMASADMLPLITEPLWQTFRCKLDITPVMVLDDLMKGMQNLPK